MADVELLPCGECGMPCRAGEYHPFAACLMFKACHNSETVRANLAPLQAEIERLQAEVERLRRLVQERDTMLGKRLCSGTNADGKPRCIVLAEERARAERLAEALEDIRSRSSINLAMHPDPFELTARLGDIYQIADSALDQGGGERAFWGPLPKVGGPDWTGYDG